MQELLPRICIYLDLPKEQTNELKWMLILDKLSLEDAVTQALETFRQKNGHKATLKRFMEVLKIFGMNQLSGLLENEFCRSSKEN